MSEDKVGSGVRQWGEDWFFRREGNKVTVNAAALKWGVGAAVAVFAAVQFTDASSAVPSPTSKGEAFGTPAALNPSSQHEFPVAEERPAAPVAPGKVRRQPLKLGAPQLIARPRNLATIPPGSMVRAVLESGASNGLAKARLEEPLLVNGDAVLESGATLVGQGNSTEERLFLAFNQVVFRDGSFGNIKAQACDGSDQIVGLKGSKVGTKALNILGSIGLGLAGGLSEGLQDTQGQQGVAVRPPTVRNAVLHATATTALEQSRNMMSDLKEQKPVIEVPAGTSILVLFGAAQ